jgi:S-layer homology domain
MLFRRLGALIAVLTIAGLPLAVQAADSAAPVPGMTGEVIDAQAQIDALKDLPRESWAYQSILDLVNDGIIVGYPDGTFKGNRPLTRYEAAVMTERAVQYLTKKLANPQTASDVSQKDISAIRDLLDAFRGDIIALRLRVGDIDSRLKSVEATQKTVVEKQNNDEATMARAKLGLVDQIRAGSFNDQVAAFNGDGRALLPSVGLTPVGGQTQVGPGGNVSAPRYLTGNNTAGYGYNLLRVLLDGQLDKSTSYHIRLENVYNWDTSGAFQAGALNGSSTFGGVAESSPNNTGGTYPRSTGIRLNYAYAQYLDPNGFLAEAGRINETDGTLGLAWADQFNGAELGYVKGPVNVRAGYFFDYPALNQIQGTCVAGNNPAPLGARVVAVSALPCGVTTQTVLGNAQYNLTKQITFGGAYEDDINSVINSWNPSVCYTGAAQCSAAATAAACAVGSTNCAPFGLYQNTVTNLQVGSVFARYANPTLLGKFAGVSLEAEGLMRFGKDPFTGSNWKQNGAVWVQGKIGSYTAHRGGAYLEAGYIGAGLNSTGAHNAIVNGVNYENQFLGNPNGYQIGYVGAHYWFSQYGRIGIIYNAYDLLPGTTYPLGTATCPGCYMTHDIGQGVFLQTTLSF